MDAKIELKKAQNEVQRKIGRNLILFQRVEHVLKWLVANTRIKGYLSEIKPIRERQTAEVSKFTMGNESIKSWQETEKYLDRQFEMFLPEHDELQSMIKGIQESRKEIAEFLISEEGERQLTLGWLQQENIVLLLRTIATQHARQDGWTMLSTAGQRIEKEVPGELAALKRRYRCKTLRELILATELFEIAEETTDKGFRALYRLKLEEPMHITSHQNE